MGYLSSIVQSLSLALALSLSLSLSLSLARSLFLFFFALRFVSVQKMQILQKLSVGSGRFQVKQNSSTWESTTEMTEISVG